MRLVAAEKRGLGEVDVADALQAALVTLAQRAATAGPTAPASELPPLQPPRTLYKQFEAAYHEFHEAQTGLLGKMDGGQGKALNDIINYLLANSRTRDAAGALKSWTFLLKHWHQVAPFLQKQKALTAINKYLVELLEDVRKANQQKVVDKKAPSPATLRQIARLKSELEDAQRSLLHFSSCEPYDGLAAHYDAAEARVNELQQQLQKLA